MSKSIKDLKKWMHQNKKPHGILNIKNRDNKIIELKNVDKYYINGNNYYQALKNVNLAVEKGNFVVIYGQSGSGKSTLLNVISGLDRATNGQVIVKDTNLSALKDAQLTNFRRKNVGFIFQSYNLLVDLNAGDNARMGQVLQSDKNKTLKIEELFAEMEILHLLKSDIRNLSGGQQQRVAIARALAKNPDLIFADEPTGSLDSSSSLKVMQLLKKINHDYNTTIIVVTHDPSWKKIADQILEVKDGQVIVEKNQYREKISEIIEIPENTELTELINEITN